jgi:hypothetical protein
MRIFIFSILIFNASILKAQTFGAMAKESPLYVSEINLEELKENQIYISMPFAKKTVLNPNQEKILAEKAVIKIELVYTKYRTSESFNQEQLNVNRLQELNSLAPQLFENRFWNFELISQTKAITREEGNKMFHGFIITFRPNSTNNTLSLEADYLDDLLGAMIKKDSLANDTTPQSFDIKTHYDMKIGYVHDTIWFVDTVAPISPPDFFYMQSLYQDSTVLNAFERNQNWKNFIVVTDVTGSMSPYSAQVFVWLKGQASASQAQYFVFFNDGDEKPSRRKKPLETKGIYISENSTIDKVMSTATKCMKNGSGGGESMENDVEAIIDGLKQYPKANGVILVADNLEIMRDYKYIDKISVPVHVILCGANNRVNVQYLDLARTTKGTLHTATSDITNLQEFKNGEHFFIDGKEYMYQNKKFHHVYD